jgi:hypothetical protein
MTVLACFAVLGWNSVAASAEAAPTATRASPTALPPPTPSPAPTPTPSPTSYVRFIEADLLAGERVANAYVPNLTGRITNRLRAAAEFKFFGTNFFEFEYRRWDAVHPAGFVTEPLTLRPAFVSAARYREQDVLVNTSIIGAQHTYLTTSMFAHANDDGDPNLHADFGFGLERLPDPSKPASLFFSYLYYPEVTGRLSVPTGSPPANLRYELESYTLGGALAAHKAPVFLTAGIVADHYLRKQNAAADATHFALQLGVASRL